MSGSVLYQILFVFRRVLIFPRGNNVEFLSMYLDVADSAVLPYGWTRYAQFSLSVVNQIHNKFTIRKGTFLPLLCVIICWRRRMLMVHWFAIYAFYIKFSDHLLVTLQLELFNQ